MNLRYTPFIQSYEDMLQYGKTLYYWKGSNLEQDLRDGVDGPAAQQLYLTNSKGISSNEEQLEAISNDKGTTPLP